MKALLEGSGLELATPKPIRYVHRPALYAQNCLFDQTVSVITR